MLTRRDLLALGAASLVTALLPAPRRAGSAAAAEQDHIEELLAGSLFIDGVVNTQLLSCRCTPAGPGGIKRLTGIDAAALTVRVDQLTEINQGISRRSRDLVRIDRARDFEVARASRRFGAIYYVQDGFRLGGSTELLARWKQDGLRILQMTYSGPNELGGGDEPASTDLPLTSLGRQVVRELNTLRMITDVSHTGRRTTLDIVDTTTQPITANHTSAEALTRHWRAKSDEELTAIASTDGVIGVVTVGRFIAQSGAPPSIDDYVAHIDYIVQLVGIDHVGLASDSWLDGSPIYEYDYVDQHLNALDRWKNVLQRLGGRGYSDEDLRKLMGLNFLRVYQAVLDP